MADLLEFHRRNEKPQWWEMFARTELPFDDLLDSVDAIAGLKRVKGTVDEDRRRIRLGACAADGIESSDGG